MSWWRGLETSSENQTGVKMMFCFGGRPQRQAALSHIPQESEERQTLDSVFTKCSAETLAFNETDWTNWWVLSSATRPRFLLFIWWLNVLEAPKLLLPQHVFLLASLDLSTVSAEPDIKSNVRKDGIISFLSLKIQPNIVCVSQILMQEVGKRSKIQNRTRKVKASQSS